MYTWKLGKDAPTLRICLEFRLKILLYIIYILYYIIIQIKMKEEYRDPVRGSNQAKYSKQK